MMRDFSHRFIFVILLFFVVNISFAITGDVTGDNTVDVDDLIIFADEWLTEGTLCNFDATGLVDFIDFTLMAENWQGHLPQLPSKASNPNPADTATGISINTDLSWSGDGSSYNVYFGTANPPPFLATENTEATEIPTLNYETVYYWRIDSVNQDGTTAGDIWSFTTVGNLAPTASDIAISTYAYIVTPITLQGSDDGLPNPPGRIKYIITDLPDDSAAYVQDPTSGGQAKIREADLPYTLSSWGNIINFATSNAGTPAIKYKTFDKLLYSDEKTITVTVAANPQDCLSFDGGGIVSIADSDYFEFTGAKGIGLCFMTRQPHCNLMLKHESGQPGYELKLNAGRIVVNIYDETEIVSTISSSYRYNSGGWVNCIFANNDVDNNLECYIYTGTILNEWYSDEEIITASLPVGNYTNTCDLIIGQNFKGEIDAIRSYTLTMTDSFRTLAAIQPHQTAGDTAMFVPVPSVRFKCNYDGVNNTAMQIYDDISAQHLIGYISSSDHVKYIPFLWHWSDSSFFHHMR